MYGKAEKYYYDLRVVYEIESRFHHLGIQPQNQEEAAPKPEAPAGGSSLGAPSDQTLASARASGVVLAAESEQGLAAAGNPSGIIDAGRSQLR